MHHSICSARCFGNSIRTKTKEKMKLGLISSRQTIKRSMLADADHRCQMDGCGITEWMGKPVPLELDHIDGSAGNNMPDNLRLICPNGHAQQPTSKGKNRGNGRTSRGLPLG